MVRRLALLVSVLGAGCAVGVGYSVPLSGGSGEPVESEPAPAPAESEEVAGVITPGKSMQRDVFHLLGPPTSEHRDERGNVVWTYWSTETAGGHYAHRATKVVFDVRGVVVRVDSHLVSP